MTPAASDPSTAPVEVSDLHAVRTLRLNRPQALNSLNGALFEALMQALEQAADDPSVRCLVLTGAGRGFCAGQDLADPAVRPAPEGAEGQDSPSIQRLIEARYIPLARLLRDLPVPTVAAVNGVAAGAGASLALLCDLVVAARSASFIQAFSRIGLVPDCGGTWLLPRLAGRGRALGMALLGDKLPAEQAQAAGLVWQVHEDAELPAAAQALGERLAALPTAALVATRHAIDASSGLSLDEALHAEARLQGRMGASADAREGMQAFLERRPPRFTDRPRRRDRHDGGS